MKTIREWLEELPEPYRTQALNNADNLDSKALFKSLYNVLQEAFIWEESPEGGNYWINVQKILENERTKMG